MRTLYPEIAPYRTHRLAVDALHTLHVEECGNPDGIPVIFLHGGPGAGLSPVHRRFFDPARYRIVLFDQRGTGQSTPFGELRDNTTAHLIADIEAVRALAGIERWLVFGGSWGAALAVAWCGAHPQHCLGAILRGSFLTGRADLDWFFGPEGVGAICAEAWSALCTAMPEAAQGRALAALCAALAGPDLQAAAHAAQAWAAWEDAVIAPAQPAPPPPARDAQALAALIDKYRVQAHYLIHHCFLDEDGVLEAARRMTGIPVALLHGRLDLVCRARNALRLHQALPGSRLRLVDGVGHSPFEPAMTRALVEALEHFAIHGDFSGWAEG